MEYKKRDRTGETYFDWIVVGPGKESGTWVMRCKCGREKVAPTKTMFHSKSCKSCCKKANNKNLGKFLASNNTLKPKRPQLKYDVIYEIDYSKCLYPIFGKLVSEYQNSACFEIVDCNTSDRKILVRLGNRINVSKKKVTEISSKS